jgi:hypothetical protein
MLVTYSESATILEYLDQDANLAWGEFNGLRVAGYSSASDKCRERY